MRCTNASGFYDVCPGAQSGTTQNPDLIIGGGDYSDTDTIEIDLYNGGRLWATGYHPTGGIALSMQSDFAICDACVILDVGFSATTHKFSDQYIATAGTMDITVITGATAANPDGHLTGTLTGVELSHVLIDTTNNTSTIINDGCTVSIPALSFDEGVLNTASFAPDRPAQPVRARRR